MSATDKAKSVLREAESDLRSIVAEAASAGDYTDVMQVASWAKSLRDLLDEQPSTSPLTSVSAHRRTVGKTVRTLSNYPRFHRQGNSIVRVAWSKREKAEYQQRAPHDVLDALAAAMERAGAGGRVFSTEEFLPIEHEGTMIPAYQSYLGIALFKQIGLIDQHGRKGYSIPKLAEFRSRVAGVWAKLPKQ